MDAQFVPQPHAQEGAARCMSSFGRKFEHHIGEAFLHADSKQRERILSAFPDLFEKFNNFSKDRRR